MPNYEQLVVVRVSEGSQSRVLYDQIFFLSIGCVRRGTVFT